MKGLTILGRIFKIGFYAFVVSIIAKLALVAIYGYSKIDASYGAAFFFNWRYEHMDKKISKSSYATNKIEEQNVSELFEYYLKNVQNEGDFAAKTWPYYAYGLPDTFVLEPRKTWTIFQTKPKENFEEDKKMMDLDFQFLEMRAKFITKTYNIKYDENSLYFPKFHPERLPENPTAEDLEKSKKKLKPVSPKNYFSVMKKSEIDSFFSTNDFNGIQKNFKGIVQKILKGEKEYYVQLDKTSAKMTDKLSADVMPLVKNAFKGFSVSEADVNDFFYRMAIVSPNVKQVHILNRLYFYFLYSYSYLEVDNIKDEKYDEFKKIVEDIKADKSSGDLSSEKKRKLFSNESKMFTRRTELIFNEFTSIFASILGTRGAIIDKDERGILEKFGNPNTIKNAETNILKDQIIKSS